MISRDDKKDARCRSLHRFDDSAQFLLRASVYDSDLEIDACVQRHGGKKPVDSLVQRIKDLDQITFQQLCFQLMKEDNREQYYPR